MKTAGIITLYGLDNYGNRLQNYAVQKILTDLGFCAKTYSPDLYYYNCFGKRYRIKKRIHEATGYRFASTSVSAWAKTNRQVMFERFTKKYLPTELVQDLNTLKDRADFFVLGSDQVWNPTWYFGCHKELYLLTFAEPGQKVCFAPSFGVSKLPDEWKPWFSEHLQTFPSLNVREQAGAEIIKELTGRNASVMIDPTLLLDAKEWKKIAKKPYGVNTRRPFLLTYFLGDRTEQIEHDISEVIKTRQCNVYHLLDESQPFVFASGPSEFLYLFSKADLILTDSFHACIFAFLFGKPFVVYHRVQAGECEMNSRIECLLKILHLEQNDRKNITTIGSAHPDYTSGWKNIVEERRAALNVLLESFGE